MTRPSNLKIEWVQKADPFLELSHLEFSKFLPFSDSVLWQVGQSSIAIWLASGTPASCKLFNSSSRSALIMAFFKGEGISIILAAITGWSSITWRKEILSCPYCCLTDLYFVQELIDCSSDIAAMVGQGSQGRCPISTSHIHHRFEVHICWPLAGSCHLELDLHFVFLWRIQLRRRPSGFSPGEDNQKT